MYPDWVYEEYEAYKKYGLMGLKSENKEKEKLNFDDILPLRNLHSIGDWVKDDGYIDVSGSVGVSRHKILWDPHRGKLYLDREYGKECIDLSWQRCCLRSDKDGYIYSMVRYNWYDYDFVIKYLRENIKEV